MKSDMIDYSGVCQPQCFPRRNQILCAKQMPITETIILPAEKPDIEQVVQVYANAHIDNYKVISSPIGKKIYMKGTLSQQILYVADLPSQPVHAVHSTVPFCNFIDIHPSCTRHQYQHILCNPPQVLIEFIEAVAVNPREISKCAILFFWFSKPTPPLCLPKNTGICDSEIEDIFSRTQLVDLSEVSPDK